MDKKIFIINGTGKAGKDTFVQFIDDELRRDNLRAMNCSSVDKIKDAARILGWTGRKTERDRKFLSDLKALSHNYNDMPFRSIVGKICDFYGRDNTVALFIHIREPEAIARAKHAFDAETILVVRDDIDDIKSNVSDANVNNYEYDYVIHNNSGLEGLKEIAKEFTKKHLTN